MMIQKKKNYFLVCCKCGHVGRSNFIRLIFPVRALNAREAAMLGRQRPGVKHDHPDAVLWVREVEKTEFLAAVSKLKKDIYWKSARRNQGLLIDRLEAEPEHKHVIKVVSDEKAKRSVLQNFRRNKNKVIEDEIRVFIAKEYQMAV
jgi:hypothetical protein